MLAVRVNIDGRRATEDVFWLGEDVLDESLRDDAQGDFAIDAAEGQVVDLVAEGRNIGAFGRVEIDGQQVVSVEVNVRSELETERSVAALVFAEFGAVDPDGRGGHRAFEVYEDTPALSFGGELEAAAIDGNELIGLVVEAMPRQLDVGVGD